MSEPTEPKKLTKKQLSYAATLYALATNAHSDCGGADTEEETLVMKLCGDRAESRLNNMGYELGDVGSIASCIDLARRR